MIQHIGKFEAKGKRFGIVTARFNEFITRRLLASAVETLEQAGVSPKHIETAWVPGALEIPYFCKKFARQKSAKKRKFDGLIALGCVIRGETYHYEAVANEVTRGVSQVALEEEMPIATGILTVENLDQAIDRAGLKAGNKGAQAALAALEIASLNQKLDV